MEMRATRRRMLAVSCEDAEGDEGDRVEGEEGEEGAVRSRGIKKDQRDEGQCPMTSRSHQSLRYSMAAW